MAALRSIRTEAASSAAPGTPSAREARLFERSAVPSAGFGEAPTGEEADGPADAEAAGRDAAAVGQRGVQWGRGEQCGGGDGGNGPPEEVAPRRADEASPNLTLAERYDALQRQTFVLEAQLQRQRSSLLQKDAALAAAEAHALRLRGIAAKAEEEAAAKDARVEAAEATASAASAELSAVRSELEALRVMSDVVGRSEDAWAAERAELLKAAARTEDRWKREAAAARLEHERAMRSLEEDLAFETASREFDRREAQQLSAALLSQQRGGPSAAAGGATAPGSVPLGTTPSRSKPARPKLSPASSNAPKSKLPPPSDRPSGRGAPTPPKARPRAETPKREGGEAAAAPASSDPAAPAPPPAPPLLQGKMVRRPARKQPT